MPAKKSSRPDKTRVLVFVGTRKGAFILSSNRQRKEWKVSGPHCKGWEVMHVNLDPRDRRLHLSAVHAAYGPSTHFLPPVLSVETTVIA